MNCITPGSAGRLTGFVLNSTASIPAVAGSRDCGTSGFSHFLRLFKLEA